MQCRQRQGSLDRRGPSFCTLWILGSPPTSTWRPCRRSSCCGWRAMSVRRSKSGSAFCRRSSSRYPLSSSRSCSTNSSRLPRRLPPPLHRRWRRRRPRPRQPQVPQVVLLLLHQTRHLNSNSTCNFPFCSSATCASNAGALFLDMI